MSKIIAGTELSSALHPPPPNTLKHPYTSWNLTVAKVPIVEYKRKVIAEMMAYRPQKFDLSPFATISLREVRNRS